MDTLPFHVTDTFVWRRTPGDRTVRVKSEDRLINGIYKAKVGDGIEFFVAGIYWRSTPGFCAAGTTTHAHCYMADDDNWFGDGYDIPRSMRPKNDAEYANYPVPSINVMMDHPSPYTYKDKPVLLRLMLRSLAGALMGFTAQTGHGAAIGASNNFHHHHEVFSVARSVKKVILPLRASWRANLFNVPRSGAANAPYSWLDDQYGEDNVLHVKPKLLLTEMWHNDNSDNMVHNMALTLNSTKYDYDKTLCPKMTYWRDVCRTVGYVNLLKEIGGN